jgi:nucleoside 2-deoxyribosyltransferase
MKVYLASRYSTKDEIKIKAEELKELGIESTSRWVHEKYEGSTQLKDCTDSFLLGAALLDLEDIRRADVVVLFSVDPQQATVRGGRHWESGYAYGIGKPLVVCGPVENIFHLLPDVKTHADWELTKLDLLRRKFEFDKQDYNFGIGPTRIQGTAIGSQTGRW